MLFNEDAGEAELSSGKTGFILLVGEEDEVDAFVSGPSRLPEPVRRARASRTRARARPSRPQAASRLEPSAATTVVTGNPIAAIFRARSRCSQRERRGCSIETIASSNPWRLIASAVAAKGS